MIVLVILLLSTLRVVEDRNLSGIRREVPTVEKYRAIAAARVVRTQGNVAGSIALDGGIEDQDVVKRAQCQRAGAAPYDARMDEDVAGFLRVSSLHRLLKHIASAIERGDDRGCLRRVD